MLTILTFQLNSFYHMRQDSCLANLSTTHFGEVNCLNENNDLYYERPCLSQLSIYDIVLFIAMKSFLSGTIVRYIIPTSLYETVAEPTNFKLI